MNGTDGHWLKLNELEVVVSVTEGDKPFIYGVRGHLLLELGEISRILAELDEAYAQGIFNRGDGDYVCDLSVTLHDGIEFDVKAFKEYREGE